MKEKHLWDKASQDIEEAFISFYWNKGYTSINPVTIRKAIRADARLARKKKVLPQDRKHEDCLCYHAAIIDMGACRAPECQREEAMRTGMNILMRYLDNLS